MNRSTEIATSQAPRNDRAEVTKNE